MVGVILIENDGGVVVVEGRRRDDGGDGMRRGGYVKRRRCSNLSMSKVMLLLMAHVMLSTLLARAFPCYGSLPNISTTCTLQLIIKSYLLFIIIN